VKSLPFEQQQDFGNQPQFMRGFAYCADYCFCALANPVIKYAIHNQGEEKEIAGCKRHAFREPKQARHGKASRGQPGKSEDAEPPNCAVESGPIELRRRFSPMGQGCRIDAGARFFGHNRQAFAQIKTGTQLINGGLTSENYFR
jgi:hypothetical protein